MDNKVVVFHSTKEDMNKFGETVKYWSNACGDLHHHGQYDITEDELPLPLKRAYQELWREDYGNYCYLVETPNGYGIALVSEYDTCFAEDCNLSMEEVFEKVCVNTEKIAKNPAFKNAEIFIGEHSGIDECHEVVVVFPAVIPVQEFQNAAKTLDEQAYQFFRTNIQLYLDREEIQQLSKATGIEVRNQDDLQAAVLMAVEKYVETYLPNDTKTHSADSLSTKIQAASAKSEASQQPSKDATTINICDR